MEQERPTLSQVKDYSFRRAEHLKTKDGAVWVTFFELDGLLNISKLAKKYLNKSQSWFSQKLHGNNVCNKERSFTKAEYAQLADALRTIGNRLIEYANGIDNAKMDEDYEES